MQSGKKKVYRLNLELIHHFDLEPGSSAGGRILPEEMDLKARNNQVSAGKWIPRHEEAWR